MSYLGNQPATNFASVTKDTFNGGDTSGASSVSEYTLSKPATTNGVAVYVENVRQIPTTAYTVSGTTLTFTGTTPSGTNNVYVLHHNAVASTATHPSAQALTATSGTFSSAVTINTTDTNFDAGADDLIVGSGSGDNGITIYTGSSAGDKGSIFFADSTVGSNAEKKGQISYEQNNEIMTFFTNHTLAMQIDLNGHVTKPLQPCFLVRNSSDQSNLTTNGGLITVVFDTEVFDQNADFDDSSSTFQAPVTGRYLFTYNVNLAQVDADHTILALTLSTSNNAFTNNPIISPTSYDADVGELALNGAIICDMDANDTALVKIAMEGGSSQTDIKANGVRTNFGGVLLC